MTNNGDDDDDADDDMMINGKVNAPFFPAIVCNDDCEDKEERVTYFFLFVTALTDSVSEESEWCNSFEF